MAEARCYGCMNIKTQPVCEHCGWDERRNNLSHQLPVGTLLRGQYVIGRALGQGGFGITYLGWDQYLDIPVAIKEYYPSGIVSRETSVSTVVCCYDGEIGERYQKSKDRFMRESRMLARFSDMPEVVQVKSFFPENNTAYIVMEYVQGITMKEYVRRMGGRLSMERTLEMLRPVIQTLEKLHQEGIVHRDISPDNIMILPNGRMKLIDFGAVRDVSHADVDVPLSRSTEAILKQGFAPIEQYQNRGSLGPWTDVYALCATIYYCVTGRVLLDAPGRLLDSPELNLRQTVAMTAGQEQTLNRGLELLPAKRIRSMAELEQGLYGADVGATVPVDDGKTIPLDDGRTVPLDDGRTGPLDDGHTIPLDPNRPVPKWDETKPIEDVVVEETKPKPRPKKKTTELTMKQRLIGLVCVFAVFAVVCLFVKLGAKEPEQDPAAFTFSPELQKDMDEIQAAMIEEKNSQITPVLSNMEYTLMEMPPSFEFGTFVTWNDGFFGQTKFDRKDVLYIKFVDYLPPDDVQADSMWDVSQAQDGSIMAWMQDSTLYIGSLGKILANPNCRGLFAGFERLSEIDFGGRFDTRNVTDMSYMFYNAGVFELDLSFFNTSNVTDMSAMFKDNLIGYIDLGGFDTSNVTSMFEMFAGCEHLTYLNISSFDTSKVTNMGWMFSRCDKGDLDLSHFDTSNVVYMDGMFNRCSMLKKLDVSSFNTQNVTDMDRMFNECSGLKELDLSNFDTANVTNMFGMFQMCKNLESLDISGFSSDSLTDSRAMFGYCNKLKDLKCTDSDIVKEYENRVHN